MKRGRVRNGYDRMKKPNDYVDSGVPYESGTLSLSYTLNEPLSIEYLPAILASMLGLMLCAQLKPRTSPDFHGHGVDAKRVRVKGRKPK